MLFVDDWMTSFLKKEEKEQAEKEGKEEVEKEEKEEEEENCLERHRHSLIGLIAPYLLSYLVYNMH